MKMEKLNLETELQKALNSVDYKLMLNKCGKYKVKISGNENLAELCIKYLNKKNQMKDWEFSPEDFLNPDEIIEDIVAEIIIAKNRSQKTLPALLKSLSNILSTFISISEFNELFDYYKLELKNNNKISFN